MEIGWIDFSRNDRSKVLNVLASLGERETLDELGISPIRDGFAELFFPGTSTLQTKAKYFLIIPYACRMVELSDISTPEKASEMLYEIERECCEKLCEVHSDNRQGIIGNDAIGRENWVKRAPSVLYWAGLRKFGICTRDKLSLSGYLKVMCAQKSRKAQIKSFGKLGNRNDGDDMDDLDAGEAHLYHYFDVPADFKRDAWRNDLSLRLTQSEAAFLKEKIIENAKGSLLADILEKNKREFCAAGSFEEIGAFVPEHLQREYKLALDFSKFLYALRVVYNVIVSNGENKRAAEEFQSISENFEAWADVDIETIFLRLGIANGRLKRFLLAAQNAMRIRDEEELKRQIKERERSIKGESRSKCYHAGTFDPEEWFGGGYLDYRFPNARTIISDIFEGENNV